MAYRGNDPNAARGLVAGIPPRWSYEAPEKRLFDIEHLYILYTT